MDYLHAILKWVDYNRYKVVAVVLTLVLAGWIVGCQSTTTGLQGKKVTSPELEREYVQAERALVVRVAAWDQAGAVLQAEIDGLESDVDIALADIARQDAFREQIVNIGGGLITTLATGGTVNIAALIPTLIGAGAIFTSAGAWADGRRKDKIIVAKNGA